MQHTLMRIFFTVFFTFFVSFSLWAGVTKAHADNNTEPFLTHFYKVFEYNQGTTFPDLQFSTMDDTVQLRSQWQPSRFYLINLWAAWCAPCIAEIPSLQRLQKKFSSQDLRIVFASMDYPKSGEDLAAKMKAAGIKRFNSFYFEDNEIWNVMPVDALPVTFLIDQSGQIHYSFVGDAPWSDDDAVRFITSVIRK